MDKGNKGFVNLSVTVGMVLVFLFFTSWLATDHAVLDALDKVGLSDRHPTVAKSSTSVGAAEDIAPTSVVTPRRSHSTTTVVFLGDILLARDVERRQQRFGWSYPFVGLASSSVTDNAYVIANFESAIPAVHQPTPDLQTRFSTPTSTIPALREAGITHVSLANNHSFDFGIEGYQHTLQTLHAQRVMPFGHPGTIGASSTIFLSVAGKPVSITAVNSVLVNLDETVLDRELQRASAQSELQVVYVHWGTEYQFAPNAAQRRLATLMASSGADLIIGHHPHVVQNIEIIDDVPVIYSLGNYIFDQYFSIPVQQGLVVTLDMSDEPTLHLHPVSSVNARNQPRHLVGAARAQFLADLAGRSDPQVATAIASGTLLLPLSLASATKTAMMAP